MPLERAGSLMMLRIIFTLDYEIHGNGDGNPRALMVEPTDRLLKLFDEYGAKLTIMADVAEILKFKEYKEKTGNDHFAYDAIVDQLLVALSRGHDVQLHLHSSYFNAIQDQGKWRQEWAEYNFAELPYERMAWMVKAGKEFLEGLLKSVCSDYRCLAFRAANWAVSPSANVVKALLENKILIDTSVFKGGHRSGIVSFDYANAYDNMRPWPVNQSDILRKDSSGALWEFPIYSEERYILAFLTINRLYRALNNKLHRVRLEPVADTQGAPKPGGIASFDPRTALRKHAWKADFNQCSGRQLIKALMRAEKQTIGDEVVPFVLIGHSKLFNAWNESSLRPFLTFVANNKISHSFSTLAAYALSMSNFDNQGLL